MTLVLDDLHTELEAAFTQARTQLIAARLQQLEKDTPIHRASVIDCRARIDGVLDLYLDMRHDPTTSQHRP
jgi:hypothetical protein